MAVTWISVEDLRAMLGVDPTIGGGGDPVEVDAVRAANDWAYRRRRTAGHVLKDESNAAVLDDDGNTQPEDTTVAPGDDVHYGTVLLAVAFYKDRGSIGTGASFDEFPPPTFGSMTQINRLLGISRPVAV